MSKIHHYWTTPVYRSNLNDGGMVDALLNVSDMILQNKPSVEEYGTASVFDELIADGQPTVLALYDQLQTHIARYLSPWSDIINMYPLNCVTKMQLCVLQPGEVTAYHGHDYSFLTGIVYLSPLNTGLILHDPRVNAARGYPQQLSQQFADITIVPSPGDVIILPSYVYHSTMVHNGESPRVVIPFNVMHK